MLYELHLRLREVDNSAYLFTQGVDMTCPGHPLLPADVQQQGQYFIAAAAHGGIVQGDVVAHLVGDQHTAIAVQNLDGGPGAAVDPGPGPARVLGGPVLLCKLREDLP